MKKSIIYFLTTLTLLTGITACDKGFDELNKNPVQPTSLNPGFLMNYAIIMASFPSSTLPYELAIVQQMVTPYSGVLAGGNFNQDNRPVTLGNWNNYYREVIKHTTDVMQMTMEDESKTNLYQMARIWYSLAAMILTDTYGEVPYFDAGLGYLEGIATPQYDPQQQIYQALLTVLEQATANLDDTKSIETGDVLYGGDVEKWKRFGNSLMLRAAMRLSKVDTDLASEYVAKAVAGGLMQANADNAAIRHDFNYVNPVGNILNATEANNFYLAKPFVDYLSSNNDPRLASIAVRYVGATSGPDQNSAIDGTPPENVYVSTIPADQVGMPMGFDNATIIPVAESQGLASFYDYSQLDRTRMGKRDAPAYLVTYAETQLLLAEAVIRGWVQGNAAGLFEEGIRADMEQLAEYGEDTAVPPEAIEAYIQAHPLNTANALEQINNQYWVASFLNGPEAFANFRRTGYPILTPNPFPGSEIQGDFIHRLTYPDAEFAVNTGHIREAISRQGPDNLDTQVWWDVEQ